MEAATEVHIFKVRQSWFRRWWGSLSRNDLYRLVAIVDLDFPLPKDEGSSPTYSDTPTLSFEPFDPSFQSRDSSSRLNAQFSQ